MLPPGALAVALLLNGAQILLPSPAFVDQGRTWVPARAILQRLGEEVRWLPATSAMQLRLRSGHSALFPLSGPPSLDGSPLGTGLSARRVGSTVYLPLVALRSLGLRVHWDAGTRRAVLQAPLPLPGSSLAAILADPPAYNYQPVTLSGEYLGWSPDPFSFATSGGPPVSSGDWVLHNEDGAIYCSPAPAAAAAATPAAASLARIVSPPPAFTPYAALGQRLTVTGQLRLTRQARPYLAFTTVSRPEGVAGLTCRLILSRDAYATGDTVCWTLQVANPGTTRVALDDLGEVTLTAAGPDGNLYLRKQSLPAKTIAARGLAAGEEATVEGAFTLPADAVAGQWAIVARVTDQLGTYRRCFAVQPAGGQLP